MLNIFVVFTTKVLKQFNVYESSLASFLYLWLKYLTFILCIKCTEKQFKVKHQLLNNYISIKLNIHTYIWDFLAFYFLLKQFSKSLELNLSYINLLHMISEFSNLKYKFVCSFPDYYIC